MRLESPETCRALRNVLSAALEVLVVVKKSREIYYLDNVKVHLDCVDRLGSFVEVEASSPRDEADSVALEKQCRETVRLLQLDDSALVPNSYSELLLRE